MQPKAIILTGYGINCEEETAKCFEFSGATTEIVHINDLISKEKSLDQYQIVAFPGGFSYGDDTGSGNAYANKMRNNFKDEVLKFVKEDKLVIGICNGCQIIANLGLVPALNEEYGTPQIALMHNATARYECRWVHMKNQTKNSPWTRNINIMHVPVSHGEGNFYMPAETYQQLKENDQIAFTYTHEDGQPANQEFPINPNGSMHDIAGITDTSGRILALMPHPERFSSFTNEQNWPLKKEELVRQNRQNPQIPQEGKGLKIFQNAVEYFT